MQRVIDVVKRGGRRPSEPYARNKLHQSVFITCMSLRTPEGHAESTASRVCDEIERWLSGRDEVTSDDLRRQASRILFVIHPDAAELYQHHHMIM